MAVLPLLVFLAGTLAAQQTRHVIIVVIDGVRYTETFGDSAHQWIPRIWTHLRPQGVIFTSYYNAGVTTTVPGHASILTGTWQTIANDGLTRPHLPTVFEYYRKSLGGDAGRNVVVLGKKKLNVLAYSDHPHYGASVGASVASTPAELVDQLAADTLKRVIRTQHPTLAILNLPNTDSVAHGDSWDGYVSSLRNADSLVYEIWSAVQSDSIMKGKTTMFVTNDHGRHTTSFTGHGDGCEGCRHLMLLAIGPDTPPGVIDAIPRFQVDIAPTIGVLLGFGTPLATGKVLSPAIATFCYAHEVALIQPHRDSVQITARVANPLGHPLSVAVTFRDDRGGVIDSVGLKDDGLHGDGAPQDGLWGCMYAPGPEGSLHAHLRTLDRESGTSTGLADAAHVAFTRGPLIALDPGTMEIGRIANTLPVRDTTFTIRNNGFAPDSLVLVIDPVNVAPDTAIAVSATSFFLAERDSHRIHFTIRPQLLAPQYYTAGVTVIPKTGKAQTSLLKVITFEIAVPAGASQCDGQMEQFALYRNYPNPFNVTTNIRYSVGELGSRQQALGNRDVKLTVYDLLGREKAVLVDEGKAPGMYQVEFDGAKLASGVYVCRMTAGSFVASIKMLLLR